MRLRLTGAVLVLLGLVAAATAVASATLWRPADHIRAEALASGATTMLVTEPGVLELADDAVAVRATAPEGTRVVIAVGREADVLAWVGADAHTLVTGLADEATLATRPGAQPEPSATPSPSASPAASPNSSPEASPDASPAPAPAEPTASPADPASSDMWVARAEGVGSAELSWTHRPGRWSMLVATTGAGAAQPTLELTWPREVVTPWFVPGLWTGGVLALVGALMFVLAWRAAASTEPRWVDVDHAAGEPEEEPRTSGVPGFVPVAASPGPVAAGTVASSPVHAVSSSAPGFEPSGTDAPPLTRRQLREIEAARAAERSRRPALPTVRRGTDAPVELTPAQPAPPAQPVQSVQPAQPAQPAQTAQPAQPAASNLPGAPAQTAQPAPGRPEPFVPTAPPSSPGREPGAAAPAAPYVPTFAPPRTGGVVPHVPAAPTAPRPPHNPAQPTTPQPTTPQPGWPQMGTPQMGTPQSAPPPQTSAPQARPGAPAPTPPASPWAPTGMGSAPAPVQPDADAATGPEAATGTDPAPASSRGTAAMRRLFRRERPDAAETARPEQAPDDPAAQGLAGGVPAEQQPAPVETPSPAPQQGSASADAWRARWGFVDMPPSPTDNDSGEQGGAR